MKFNEFKSYEIAWFVTLKNLSRVCHFQWIFHISSLLVSSTIADDLSNRSITFSSSSFLLSKQFNLVNREISQERLVPLKATSVGFFPPFSKIFKLLFYSRMANFFPHWNWFSLNYSRDGKWIIIELFCKCFNIFFYKSP